MELLDWSWREKRGKREREEGRKREDKGGNEGKLGFSGGREHATHAYDVDGLPLQGERQTYVEFLNNEKR